MPPPNRSLGELLRLYRCAAAGEYNLSRFLRERPEFVAHLGVVALDLDRDDGEVALQIATAVGRYKKKTVRQREELRAATASSTARQLALIATRRNDRVELDAVLLLGDLLADETRKYIAFELATARISVLRVTLVKARVPLRRVVDLEAYLDESGLHLRWCGGRGGLNFRPQVEERRAEVLHVDLRTPQRRRTTLLRPVLLADVHAELGRT